MKIGNLGYQLFQPAYHTPRAQTPQTGEQQDKTVARKNGLQELYKIETCDTCENRRYQDGSDDPSVSFQTPTNIAPEQSAAEVLAHEMEHVHNEQTKATQEGREVVYQSVVLHGSVCPECGKNYVAGGETKTVTRGKPPQDIPKGLFVDLRV